MTYDLYKKAAGISMVCLTLLLFSACNSDTVYKRKIEQSGNTYSKENFIAQAAAGNLELVEWYLKAGMGVNHRGNKYGGEFIGKTALLMAARNGHLDIVKLLIENHAAIEKETKAFRNINDNGETPLMAAAERGHLEIVKLLHQKGAKLDRRGNIQYETALLVAAKNGQFEVVKYLADQGANLEIPRLGSKQSIYLSRMHGKTALHYAVDIKHKEMITYLVKKGADINKPKSDEYTPLMTALFEGDRDIFNLLLDLGANINYQDKSGKSILMHAILYGGDKNIDKVKQVIAGGANLNLKENEWGWTALMFAANKGFEKTVKLLLEHNADTAIKDVDGQNVVDIAKNSKQDKILTLLSQFQKS